MFDAELLADAVGKLDENMMTEILNQVMADGGSDAEMALNACQRGLDIVGDYFAREEYYVGDLIFAGELMTEAFDILRPALARKNRGRKLGTVLLCTVAGDVHDIGKNLVRAYLEAANFNVLDLGVDVSAQTVADTAAEQQIPIVALSGVLTMAIVEMQKTVKLVKEKLPECKVVIGGLPTSENVCRMIGADAWADAPVDTVRICREWMGVKGTHKAVGRTAGKTEN